jgi:hypothetical protein
MSLEFTLSNLCINKYWKDCEDGDDKNSSSFRYEVRRSNKKLRKYSSELNSSLSCTLIYFFYTLFLRSPSFQLALKTSRF